MVKKRLVLAIAGLAVVSTEIQRVVERFDRAVEVISQEADVSDIEERVVPQRIQFGCAFPRGNRSGQVPFLRQGRAAVY